MTATSEGQSGIAAITVTAITFSALAGGEEFTCGLATGTGAAFCWGRNDHGQLGTGSLVSSLVPAGVAGGLSFTALAVGWENACGLTASGAAYCWGRYSGALVNGAIEDSPVPVPVSGGLRFKTLATGSGHTCGITLSDAAYCWWYGPWGELGNGSFSWTPTLVPVAVAGGLVFSQVATGNSVTCGVTTSGAAYCWGYNGAYGLFGNGSTDSSAVPVPVSGGIKFTSVSIGEWDTCGLAVGGAAYCWGEGRDGELGNGVLASSLVPVAVAGGLGFTQVIAWGGFACGLATGGSAYCWGWGTGGQLGNGSLGESAVPVPVAGGHNFAALAAGRYHACGFTTSGVAYCWGGNSAGQLGTGSAASSSVPVKVVGQP